MGVRTFPGPEVAPYRDGDLMYRVNARRWHDRAVGPGTHEPEELRPNDPFWAELTLASTGGGRATAVPEWADEHGRRLPMLVVDMFDLMRDPRGVQGGKARGWWVVVKRRQNFGIMRLRPEQEPRLT